MSNIYRDYNELAEFFGTDVFESLDVDLLSTLSFDALFRLQDLIMQSIKTKSNKHYDETTQNTTHP